MKKVFIIIGIVSLMFIGSCLFTTCSTTSTPKTPIDYRTIQSPTQAQPSAPKVSEIDKSPEMQKQREEFIDKLMKDGWIKEVKSNGIFGRVVVTQKFIMADDFENKQKIISAIHCWLWDGKNELFATKLLDSRTNKEIGSYSKLDGGLKIY